nr:MAG TPA: hypothetical protein [Caudoviricetes sp.]
MALHRTHCYTKSCYTSVKVTHKHIDMGRLLLWRLLSYHGRRPWKKSSQHLNSKD